MSHQFECLNVPFVDHSRSICEGKPEMSGEDLRVDVLKEHLAMGMMSADGETCEC